MERLVSRFGGRSGCTVVLNPPQKKMNDMYEARGELYHHRKPDTSQ